MKTKTEIAVAALKNAENTTFSRVGAYIVLHPDKPNKRGIVRASYPKDGAGKLHVFVWDLDGTDLQHSWVTGFGYDKLSAAMSNIVFDGIQMTYDGRGFTRALEERGYTVIRAI